MSAQTVTAKHIMHFPSELCIDQLYADFRGWGINTKLEWKTLLFDEVAEEK